MALWLTVALRSGALPSCTEILRTSYLSMAIWVLGSGAPVQEALASPERAAAHCGPAPGRVEFSGRCGLVFSVHGVSVCVITPAIKARKKTKKKRRVS